MMGNSVIAEDVIGKQPYISAVALIAWLEISEPFYKEGFYLFSDLLSDLRSGKLDVGSEWDRETKADASKENETALREQKLSQILVIQFGLDRRNFGIGAEEFIKRYKEAIRSGELDSGSEHEKNSLEEVLKQGEENRRKGYARLKAQEGL